MSVIGKQIRRFRLQKGYTQEQLSREVGVTTPMPLVEKSMHSGPYTHITG